MSPYRVPGKPGAKHEKPGPTIRERVKARVNAWSNPDWWGPRVIAVIIVLGVLSIPWLICTQASANDARYMLERACADACYPHGVAECNGEYATCDPSTNVVKVNP